MIDVVAVVVEQETKSIVATEPVAEPLEQPLGARASIIFLTGGPQAQIITPKVASETCAAPVSTTVRKVVLGNLPFLLSDTVGFIRKLPTQLVESFKSTLDEVREADLLLHVVDISHPSFEDHIDSVNQILSEIDCADKETIMVFNKIDLYRAETLDEDDLVTERTSRHYSVDEWKNTWMQRMSGNAVFISALNKENLEEFRKIVYREVRRIHISRFPYNNFLYPENLDQYSQES